MAAAESKLAEVADQSAEEQAALATGAAGEKAMVAAWKEIDPPTARQLDYLQTCQICFRNEPRAGVGECSHTCVPMKCAPLGARDVVHAQTTLATVHHGLVCRAVVSPQ